MPTMYSQRQTTFATSGRQGSTGGPLNGAPDYDVVASRRTPGNGAVAPFRPFSQLVNVAQNQQPQQQRPLVASLPAPLPWTLVSTSQGSNASLSQVQNHDQNNNQQQLQHARSQHQHPAPGAPSFTSISGASGLPRALARPFSAGSRPMGHNAVVAPLVTRPTSAPVNPTQTGIQPASRPSFAPLSMRRTIDSGGIGVSVGPGAYAGAHAPSSAGRVMFPAVTTTNVTAAAATHVGPISMSQKNAENEPYYTTFSASQGSAGLPYTERQQIPRPGFATQYGNAAPIGNSHSTEAAVSPCGRGDSSELLTRSVSEAQRHTQLEPYGTQYQENSLGLSQRTTTSGHNTFAVGSQQQQQQQQQQQISMLPTSQTENARPPPAWPSAGGLSTESLLDELQRRKQQTSAAAATTAAAASAAAQPHAPPPPGIDTGHGWAHPARTHAPSQAAPDHPYQSHAHHHHHHQPHPGSMQGHNLPESVSSITVPVPPVLEDPPPSDLNAAKPQPSRPEEGSACNLYPSSYPATGGSANQWINAPPPHDQRRDLAQEQACSQLQPQLPLPPPPPVSNASIVVPVPQTSWIQSQPLQTVPSRQLEAPSLPERIEPHMQNLCLQTQQQQCSPAQAQLQQQQYPFPQTQQQQLLPSLTQNLSPGTEEVQQPTPDALLRPPPLPMDSQPLQPQQHLYRHHEPQSRQLPQQLLTQQDQHEHQPYQVHCTTKSRGDVEDACEWGQGDILGVHSAEGQQCDSAPLLQPKSYPQLTHFHAPPHKLQSEHGWEDRRKQVQSRKQWDQGPEEQTLQGHHEEQQPQHQERHQEQKKNLQRHQEPLQEQQQQAPAVEDKAEATAVARETAVPSPLTKDHLIVLEQLCSALAETLTQIAERTQRVEAAVTACQMASTCLPDVAAMLRRHDDVMQQLLAAHEAAAVEAASERRRVLLERAEQERPRLTAGTDAAAQTSPGLLALLQLPPSELERIRPLASPADQVGKGRGGDETEGRHTRVWTLPARSNIDGGHASCRRSRRTCVAAQLQTTTTTTTTTTTSTRYQATYKDEEHDDQPADEGGEAAECTPASKGSGPPDDGRHIRSMKRVCHLQGSKQHHYHHHYQAILSSIDEQHLLQPDNKDEKQREQLEADDYQSFDEELHHQSSQPLRNASVVQRQQPSSQQPPPPPPRRGIETSKAAAMLPPPVSTPLLSTLHVDAATKRGAAQQRSKDLQPWQPTAPQQQQQQQQLPSSQGDGPLLLLSESPADGYLNRPRHRLALAGRRRPRDEECGQGSGAEPHCSLDAAKRQPQQLPPPLPALISQGCTFGDDGAVCNNAVIGPAPEAVLIAAAVNAAVATAGADASGIGTEGPAHSPLPPAGELSTKQPPNANARGGATESFVQIQDAATAAEIALTVPEHLYYDLKVLPLALRREKRSCTKSAWGNGGGSGRDNRPDCVPAEAIVARRSERQRTKHATASQANGEGTVATSATATAAVQVLQQKQPKVKSTTRASQLQGTQDVLEVGAPPKAAPLQSQPPPPAPRPAARFSNRSEALRSQQQHREHHAAQPASKAPLRHQPKLPASKAQLLSQIPAVPRSAVGDTCETAQSLPPPPLHRPAPGSLSGSPPRVIAAAKTFVRGCSGRVHSNGNVSTGNGARSGELQTDGAGRNGGGSRGGRSGATEEASLKTRGTIARLVHSGKATAEVRDNAAAATAAAVVCSGMVVPSGGRSRAGAATASKPKGKPKAEAALATGPVAAVPASAIACVTACDRTVVGRRLQVPTATIAAGAAVVYDEGWDTPHSDATVTTTTTTTSSGEGLLPPSMLHPKHEAVAGRQCENVRKVVLGCSGEGVEGEDVDHFARLVAARMSWHRRKRQRRLLAATQAEEQGILANN